MLVILYLCSEDVISPLLSTSPDDSRVDMDYGAAHSVEKEAYNREWIFQTERFFPCHAFVMA